MTSNINNDEIDLKQYVNIIKKRKNILFFIFLIATISTYIFFSLMEKTYRATSKIFINKEKIELKMEPQFQTYSEEFTRNTYVSLLKNRTLLKKVITKLNLNTNPESLEKSIGVNDLQSGDDKAYVLEVYADANNPVLAKDILNTLVEEYMIFFKQLKSSNTKDINEYIEKQIIESNNILKNEETKLKEFSESNSIELLQKQIKTSIDDLSTYESNLMKINNDLVEMRYSYNKLKSEYDAEKYIVSSSLVDGNSLYQDLKRRIIEFEIAKESKIVINDMKDKVKEIIKNILDKQSFQIDNLEVKKENIEKNIQKLNKYIKEYQIKISELELAKQRLERNMTLAQKSYLMLTNKKEEMKIEDKVKPEVMKIIEYAETPTSPTGPRVLRNTALVGVLSIFLGIFIIFLIEYFEEK